MEQSAVFNTSASVFVVAVSSKFAIETVPDNLLADLATERKRHLTTGKRAERTKFDFTCAICSSAIGQASSLICARSRQLTFPFCC